MSKPMRKPAKPIQAYQAKAGIGIDQAKATIRNDEGIETMRA